jgi:hypothetical protein
VGHDLTGNAGVRAGTSIGSLTVKGSLVGNVTASGAATPVIISAEFTIGKLSIGGRVERAQILGGYDVNLSALSADSQIGPVTVGGDWIDSSIAAGVTNPNGPEFLGDGHDTIIGGGASVAKIASIIIGGMVTGSGSAGEHFGFVSHFVGPFKSLGFSALASKAPTAITIPTVTSDVTIIAI